MNPDRLPQGPLYIYTWSIKPTQLSGWNITTNPIPAQALSTPEVVEYLGDFAEARAVIDYIKSL